MSLRKLIMLVLALLVGVMTYMGFKSSMTPPPGGAPVHVVEATQVLAAAKDLPTGSILRETDMKWIPWAESADNSRLFLKGKAEMTSLVGAVLREGVRADEPLLTGHVVQPHEQGFLAAVLSPGMRAVSIPLTPSTGVAGFIFPGDRVDVILTHNFSVKTDKNDAAATERRLSETIIHNARVLALDQKSDNQSTDPKVAQLATLEVTSKQAEKLMLAVEITGQTSTGNPSNRGSLSLVLRSLANDTTSTAPAPDAADLGVTMDNDISPVYSQLSSVNKVQVMRGKSVTETTFQKAR